MIRIEIELSGDRRELDVQTIAAVFGKITTDTLRGTSTVVHRIVVEEADA